LKRRGGNSKTRKTVNANKRFALNKRVSSRKQLTVSVSKRIELTKHVKGKPRMRVSSKMLKTAIGSKCTAPSKRGNDKSRTPGWIGSDNKRRYETSNSNANRVSDGN
jgi:hypothetical protein